MSLPITVVIPYIPAHKAIADRAEKTAIEAGATRAILYEDVWRIGVCGARNSMIDHPSTTELIFPLDADDELLPDGLQALYDAWQPGTLVYGDWLVVTEEGESLVAAPPPEMLNRKSVAHASWLFHRDDWSRVGGYDPDFNLGCEDWAFMVALVRAGVKPVRVKVPIYRKHENKEGRGAKCWERRELIRALMREKYPDFFKVGEPS